MNALSISKAVLAGYDWGGRAACVVAALHPEHVAGLVSCGAGYNIQDIATAMIPVAPEKERRAWYWYYLNSERGRTALTEDRINLCRFLWHHFSPTWPFSDADYAGTSAAFDNPDFVDVVLHSYRFRIGSVPGDPRFKDIEQRLAAKPIITSPTIVLMGEDDGIDPPEPRSEIEVHFSQLRDVRTLPSVGHNLPQEAPIAFVDAVMNLSTHPQ